MSDELDALVRDACSVGPAGSKSEYRKRLLAWSNRHTAAKLRELREKSGTLGDRTQIVYTADLDAAIARLEREGEQ